MDLDAGDSPWDGEFATALNGLPTNTIPADVPSQSEAAKSPTEEDRSSSMSLD